MNSQNFSTPEPTPRGSTSAQELHLELVRHYADVLRMLTERVPAPGLSATPAAAPPVQEAPEAQLEEVPASWEEASGYLHARDFRREEVVHLWLQLCYVLGTHVLVGLAVTIQGYRRIAGVIESTPQDQERMEGFLYDLDARGLSADRGLLCTVPGGVALPNAVRTVWGSRVALQRCLNTTMAEVVNGLGEVDAGRFRHRLQHAWHTCDAAEAQQALEEIVRDLDQKNRSLARVLRQHTDQTLTLQQTGMLPQTDRGLRVLSYLNTLISRVRPVIPAGPVPQRVPRLCAGLLELEPQLRRVAHAAYLPALRKSLKTLSTN